MVLAGLVVHPAEKAKEVLKFYQEYAATVPDELGSFRLNPEHQAKDVNRMYVFG